MGKLRGRNVWIRSQDQFTANTWLECNCVNDVYEMKWSSGAPGGNNCRDCREAEIMGCGAVFWRDPSRRSGTRSLGRAQLSLEYFRLNTQKQNNVFSIFLVNAWEWNNGFLPKMSMYRCAFLRNKNCGWSASRTVRRFQRHVHSFQGPNKRRKTRKKSPINWGIIGGLRFK